MPTRDYYKKVGILVLVLIIAIVGLSYVLLNGGPRVRLISFDIDPDSSSLSRNTTMTIRFDRPLEQLDYSDQIRFTPSIDFSSKTTSQTIVVTLLDNFQHNTTYVLEVGSDIVDQTGRKMPKVHVNQFSTSSPSYAYLERNYGENEDDHIKISELGSETKIVFSHPTISQFSANREYLVVAAKEEAKDKLFTVNLKNGDIREEDPRFGGQIDNLTIAANGRIALFTILPDINSVSQAFYDWYLNRVYALDVSSGNITTISGQGVGNLQAKSIQLHPDGQVALIQDLDNQFFAVSPFNDYQPILLGTHTDGLGFSDDGSSIVFRDNTNFVEYDIESGENLDLDISLLGFLQSFQTHNNRIYALHVTTNNSQIISYVSELAGWNDKTPETTWSNLDRNQYYARQFSLNYDGSLMALELNTNSCQFDNVLPNIKCQDAKIRIYDTRLEDDIAEFSGVDLVWLP